MHAEQTSTKQVTHSQSGSRQKSWVDNTLAYWSYGVKKWSKKMCSVMFIYFIFLFHFISLHTTSSYLYLNYYCCWLCFSIETCIISIFFLCNTVIYQYFNWTFFLWWNLLLEHLFRFIFFFCLLFVAKRTTVIISLQLPSTKTCRYRALA